ncbi:MAG: glycosyltransferase family 4 protein [Armatimonadetes bacterium]|nr:glycosyltransferase family 4 protein [Armatimonadota bacterium]
MHIALVSRWFPPISHGGVAVYNGYLARALVSLDHRVTVVSSRSSDTVPPVLEDEGVTVHRLLAPFPGWIGRIPLAGRYARPWRQIRYSKQVASKLTELEKRDRPDVIEFAEIEAEGLIYLRRKERCPAVVRCHTPTFILKNYAAPGEKDYDTTITSRMEQECIRRADALTAPSGDMARTIAGACGLPADRIHPVPNALDVAAFLPPAGRANRGNSGQVTVLHVGRLERLKGVEVLARAVPLVLKEAPAARFVFIGDDRPDSNGSSWQKRLESLVREFGVEERVSFLGKVEHSVLLEWYGQADIATVPAMLYESFSYTCAQAMAAGLPVVASRIGGIPETVDDGICGVLVDPGDVEDLARALIRLVNDKALRKQMGEAGQRKARERFDAGVVAERMVEIYRGISGRGE